MTGYPRRWYADSLPPRRASVDEHAELIAWEAAEDALRAVVRCSCFVTDSRGKPEYTGHCDLHTEEAS